MLNVISRSLNESNRESKLLGAPYGGGVELRPTAISHPLATLPATRPPHCPNPHPRDRGYPEWIDHTSVGYGFEGRPLRARPQITRTGGGPVQPRPKLTGEHRGRGDPYETVYSSKRESRPWKGAAVAERCSPAFRDRPRPAVWGLTEGERLPTLRMWGRTAEFKGGTLSGGVPQQPRT